MTGRDGFGGRLRACRVAAGLSQEELSAGSGVSVRAISDLERGKTRWPHPGSVHRLADALELTGSPRVDFIGAVSRRLPDAGPDQTGAAGARLVVVPRQLPPAVPVFVGRRSELASLSRVLTRPGGIAVITAIGGTAGVGKTALAVHWAHRIAADYPDGQLYVNLRGYDMDEPMPATDALAGFLRALGMPGGDIPADVTERAAAYRSLLAGKRILVLLDNVGEVSQVRPLLPGSPGCLVLVTSRDALTELAARDGARRLDLDLLSPDDATGLLRELIGERAYADPAAVEALAERCSRLPLALRIAAERVAAHPDTAIAGLVDELTGLRRLDLMDAGGDLSTSVRSVFSWSRERLDAGTDRAFRLIGLHPGPDLDQYAVAALTGTTPAQAGQMVDRLAGAHLLQRTGAGRYSMHDLLRGYARELVAECEGEAGERAAMSRVLDFYLHACASAMNVLFPAYGYSRPRLDAPGLGVPVLGWAEGERQACTDWLDAELASLVAVTARAAAAGWPAYAWRLPATIFRHLQAGARNAEAALMLRHAVRAAHAAGDQAAEASALTNLGNIKWLWGQNKEAIEHCEEALALSRACGDREQQARALNNRAIIDIREGRYDQASRRLRDSLTLFRELGDLLGQARVLITLGAIDACLGRPGSADVLLRESLAISRRAGDVVREAEALGEIGVLASKCRRYEQAERCQRQALAIFRDQGLMDGETDVLIGLGGTLLAAGRPEQAIVHLRRALRFASTSDYADMRARAAHRLGSAYLAMDDLGEARGLWEEALAIYTRLGTPSAQEVRDLLAAHPGDCGSQPITDADAARQPS